MDHYALRNRSRNLSAGLALACLLGLAPAITATARPKLAVVPKWDRFEGTFKSSIRYTNALQDATLTVIFTSPLGATQRVDGFWDGGRTWRVRFSPAEVGRWTFHTICSDTRNAGLHNLSGSFVCSSVVGQSPFRQHGLVKVAADGRHLEHQDGRPFFWLADSARDGARLSTPKDWMLYCGVRSSQGFNVVEWNATGVRDYKGDAPIEGPTNRIAINPDFFQRLDAKVHVAGVSGLLSAITPVAHEYAAQLSYDQTILLARYVVARYGGDPVAWILSFDPDPSGAQSERWKNIGKAVFARASSRPVMLAVGANTYLMDEFRDQPWVSILGVQTFTDITEDAVKWSADGPLAREWSQTPARPVISCLPVENSLRPGAQTRFTADEVRRAAYWSVLQTVPAGVAYSAEGIRNWDQTALTKKKDRAQGEYLPFWQRALFLPGGKQVARMADLVSSLPFWRLHPEPVMGAAPAQADSPLQHIASVSTTARDLALVYVPGERTLEILVEAMPPSPDVTWINPRTGERNPAVAVVVGKVCQFPTPDKSDWLLIVKAGK